MSSALKYIFWVVIMSGIISTSCKRESANNAMNYLQLKEGKMTVELDDKNGGRIRQVYFDSISLLFDDRFHDDLSGSVWWPSPQSKWNWPPPEIINNSPYAYSEIENGFILKSKKCKDTGIQLSKEYKILNDKHFSITYNAMNISNETITFGHWEVSRVPKNGRVIFPIGGEYPADYKTDREGSFFFAGQDTISVFYKESNCFDFYIDESELKLEKLNADKLFVDGAGWVGYLKGNILLVKRFNDEQLNQIAPEHGEIEIYVSPILPMVEVEQHAQYKTVAPKNTSSWTVDWLIFELTEEEKERTRLIQKVENRLTQIRI